MTPRGSTPRTEDDAAPSAGDQLWSSSRRPAGQDAERGLPDGPGVRRGLAGRRVPVAALVVVYIAALGTFVGIVGVRGGPSVGDAYGVTKPATALADGDLGAAAKASVLPQPPGYALLTSPFVLALRPLIGSPTWCDARVPP